MTSEEGMMLDLCWTRSRPQGGRPRKRSRSLGLAENHQKQNNQFLEGGGEDQGGNEAGMMA